MVRGGVRTNLVFLNQSSDRIFRDGQWEDVQKNLMHPYPRSKPDVVGTCNDNNNNKAIPRSFLNIEDTATNTWVPQCILFFAFLPLPSVLSVTYTCIGHAILRLGNEDFQYNRISLASTAAAAATGGIILALSIALLLAIVRLFLDFSPEDSLSTRRVSTISTAHRPASTSRRQSDALSGFPSLSPPPTAWIPPSRNSTINRFSCPPESFLDSASAPSCYSTNTSPTEKRPHRVPRLHGIRSATFSAKNHLSHLRSSFAKLKLKLCLHKPRIAAACVRPLFSGLFIFLFVFIGTFAAPLGVACLTTTTTTTSSSSSSSTDPHFLTRADAAIAGLIGTLVLNVSLAVLCALAWIGWVLGWRSAMNNERNNIVYIARSLEEGSRAERQW